MKKIIESEILLPFSDYNKIVKKREKITKLIIFSIIAIIISSFMFNYSYILNGDELKNFITDYIGTDIDIIALLLSFSIAYLTILISSDSCNIKKLKSNITEIKIDGRNISLYQNLLIQLTYTIYNEILLLILLLIHKMISNLLNCVFNTVFFIINMILLLNILLIIIQNVKNIYLSFWKNNVDE